MRLLLDTHVVLWQLSGTRRIGAEARAAIEEAEELAMSVVSFAEIGVKASVGKLAVPADLAARIEALDVRILQLDTRHCLSVAGLPLHHRDPFDRLLIAQAQTERLTLLSSDRRLTAYDVDLIDASA